MLCYNLKCQRCCAIYHLTVTDCTGNGNSVTDDITVTVDNCVNQYPVYIDVPADTTSPYGEYGINFRIADSPSPNGDIAVLGYLNSSTLSLSNGYSLVHNNPGNNQDFILKLNKNGEVKWAHIIQNSLDHYTKFQIHNIFIDAEENTYVAYNFFGELIFEDGNKLIGSVNHEEPTTAIIKFDAFGNIAWSVVIGNGQSGSWFKEMTSSDDAIYIYGNNYLEYVHTGIIIPQGNYLLKISKNLGELIWCKKINQPLYTPIYLAVKDNIPYMQYWSNNNSIVKLNPLDGLVDETVIKDYFANAGTYSMAYGGADMFYEIVSDGLSSPEGSIRGYRLESANGTEKLVFQKSVEASVDYYYEHGYSTIENMVYHTKSKGGYSDRFLKEDMNVNAASSIIWNKDVSNYSSLMPSVNKNLSYGFFIARDFDHSNDFVINKFNLKSGNSGHFPVKSDIAVKKESFIESNIKSSYEVYPNPTKNLLYIKKKGNDLTETTQVQVINSLGVKVYQKTMIFKDNRDKTIDISMLPVGLYVIKITDNNTNSYVSKIIKE